MAVVTFGGSQLTWFGIPVTFGGLPSSGPIWEAPFQNGIDPGPVWTWAIGPGASAASSGPTRQLTEAFGRVVTGRVDGHAFAQFSIDGRSTQAHQIVERETDVWAYRDGVLMFRGRIVQGNDDIDATQHRCQFSAVDYRGMLTQAAKIESALSFTNVNQSEIAWQLVQHRQTQTAGDWGITNGLWPASGQFRDLTDIVIGKPVGELIDEIARRDGGFEWEISELLELNRWEPRRGSNLGLVLDYGGMLHAVSTKTAEFGNVGVASGGQNTTPVVVEHPSVMTDERGRWSVSQGFPSVTEQTTVTDKATWLATESVTVERTWRVLLSPRRWRGRDQLWLGDTVDLVINSGRTQVPKVPHRVVEFQVVCGDAGEEIVSLGLVGVEAP